MELTIFDLIGSAGVAIIIVTYLLLQTGRIDSTKLPYSALNAIGSGMIIVSLWFDFNFAAFIVEFFWLLISVYGLVKNRNSSGLQG